MPNPHLSVSLPYWQDRDPLDALLVAEAADKLGYDRLWLGEMATFDAFALATAIGRAPGTIPLCIGPLAVAVRTPANIAMGAASVAALTGRRVDVALGTSSTVVVRDWHGRERRSTATHLEESARIVRQLLDGEKTEFDGAVERSNGYRLRLPAPGRAVARSAPELAELSPPSSRRTALADALRASPQGDESTSESCTESRSFAMRSGAAEIGAPGAIRYSGMGDSHNECASTAPGFELVVAAFGERALAAGARTADRVVLNLVTPAQLARCAEMVRRYAAQAHRPPPDISVWVTAAADPTPDMLLTLRRGVVGYLRAPGYDAMFEEAGFGDVVRLAHSGAHPRDVLTAIPDELPSAVGMLGDAATLTDRLAAYRAAGADEVVIVPVTTAADPAGNHTLETIAGLGRG
ncbi:LLM class flavin-dependent oxidoreductase [Nocardia acidivorans]|uniref:LLM class flavin-dependent oxidoreductase n=1 Tax=Nocardia acidivorans TaxID=404580 RepID=UPI000ACCAB21|nr:LLM class flavin-dependent oxidoreductase [Nocardia acidivorans]